MNRAICVIVVFGMFLVTGLQVANATLAQLDSSGFSWKYEMNASPESQDQAPATGVDWDYYTKASGSWSGNTAFDGTVNGDGTITTLATEYQWESDHGTARAVWDNITYASGYTFEARIKVPQATGPHGAFAIYAATPNGTTNCAGIAEVYNQGWKSEMGGNGTLMETLDNTDAFHTFRVAKEAGTSTYYLWRDGVLEGDALTCRNYGGNYLDIGSPDAGCSGATIIDYVRITSGAYAPISTPEPGALVLLATGVMSLLAYAWRKRK
jgi:hypothetical protein